MCHADTYHVISVWHIMFYKMYIFMSAYIGYIVVACHNNTVFKIYKAAF